jgi:hypothetical protein
MCLATDLSASPRTIKSFNSREIFVGGSMVERDGNTYIEVVERVTASNIARRASGGAA